MANGMMDEAQPAMAPEPGQAPDAENGLAGSAKDPMLEQIISGIEAKLDPQQHMEYQKIVIAGMRFMFSPRTHKYFTDEIERAKKDNNLTKHAVNGIVAVIGIIAKEAKGQMNVPAAFPAAITLLCKALEYVEAHSGAKPTKENVAAMIHLLVVELMKKSGIDKRKLAEGIDYARQNKGNVAPAAAPEAETTPEEQVAPEEQAPETEPASPSRNEALARLRARRGV